MTTIIDHLVLELGFDTSKLPADQQKAVDSLRGLEERADKTGARVAQTGASVSGVFRQLEHPVAALRGHLERLADYTHRPQAALQAVGAQGERTGHAVEAGALRGAAGLRALSVAGLGAFAALKTVQDYMSSAAERAQHVFNVGVGAKSAGTPIGDFSAITQAFLKHGAVPETTTGSWLSTWTQAQQDLFVNKDPAGVQALNEALQRAGIYDVNPFSDTSQQAIEKISADLHKMSPEAATAAGRALGMPEVLAQAAQKNGTDLPGYIADARQTALNNPDLKASTARLDSNNNMLINLNRLLTTIDTELTPAIVGLNNWLAGSYSDINTLMDPNSTHQQKMDVYGEMLGSAEWAKRMQNNPASNRSWKSWIPLGPDWWRELFHPGSTGSKSAPGGAPGAVGPQSALGGETSSGNGVPGAVMNYGGTGAVGAPGTNLVRLTDPQGHTYTVNKAASSNFQGFLKELEGTGYTVTSLGGYNMRDKAGGGRGLSEHAYGLAVDINPGANPFRGNHTDLPKNIHDIAAKYGLVWGGDWNDPKDPMHFQWGGPNAGTELARHRANQAVAGTTNNNSVDNDHHNTNVGDIHVHVKPDATPYMIGGAVSGSIHDSLNAAQANNGLTP